MKLIIAVALFTIGCTTETPNCEYEKKTADIALTTTNAALKAGQDAADQTGRAMALLDTTVRSAVNLKYQVDSLKKEIKLLKDKK